MDKQSGDEPGSQRAVLPVAKQALAQKRNVRDLNTRLEMYVRAQAEKTRTVNSLKEALARQEMEFRNKIKQQNLQYTDTIEKLRKENENLAYDNKCTHQELSNANSAKKEFEERLISSESRNAALSSECENVRTEVNRTKLELDTMRKQYASIKYKYDSYEMERNSFEDKMAKQKIKNEQLLRELTQKEANLKTDKETFQRVIIEKNDEIDKYRQQIKDLGLENNTTQSRLRKEFDNKLAEFVQKREEQYKQEKDEWMRIFKEEFNRKLRSFKEANQELSHSNIKQSEEITDLRARISKLKQQKTELEVTNRNNEEELEKYRNDLDDLRRTKDAEIKMKNALLLQERDRYKAKELQFDELAGIKLQLDSEIELYRNILNEAEQEIGYKSPLDAKYNTNNGQRNNRKRKRYNNNYHNMTPMGPLRDENTNTNNSNNTHSSHSSKVHTPGIARAAQIAQKDLKSLRSDGSVDGGDQEMKDKEDDEYDMINAPDSYETPGNIEGAALQFSGLDLNKGMIEIQNMGEIAIQLNGYALSNADGTAQYQLPNDMILNSKETLRIYVGEKIFEQLAHDDDSNDDDHDDDMKGGNKCKLIGGYNGAYVCWGRDVWTGNDKDCARLYNPAQKEVARIEISPDMVDKSKSKNGCLIM